MAATILRHRTPVLGISLQATMSGAIATLRLWHGRARQRWQLAELPPERLRDIGVSPAEARLEAAKPFWRA